MSKRKTVLIVAGALVTLGAVAAISAPWERGHRGWGWGDGPGGKHRWHRSVTQEQFDTNTRARFARFDSNGDGMIDASEVEARQAQRGARHARKHERRAERLLRRFDADRDGKATRDEFMQSVDKHFAEFDLDSDGRITDEDLPPAMRGRGVLAGNTDRLRRGFGRRILTLLRGADADQDGIVTREEVMAAAERRFTVLDRSVDGTLDKADVDAFRKETADYRVKRFIHRYGATAGGQVTRDQFFAKAKERFARLDRNSDGTISRGERRGRKGHGWRRRGGQERGEAAEQGGEAAPERGDTTPRSK